MENLISLHPMLKYVSILFINKSKNNILESSLKVLVLELFLLGNIFYFIITLYVHSYLNIIIAINQVKKN